MNISINVNENIKETEILVYCNKLTPDIEKLLATLRVLNQQMMVMQDDEIHIVDVAKIVYIEAVDRKTFVYTEKSCYESKLKLYEIEERLCESGFFRVSKACLVNVHFIRVIKNDINRKLRLTLENGELIMVSRQYAEEIKARLEVI